MNKLEKIAFLALVMLSSSAFAQQKVGYVNIQEIYLAMPEYDSVKIKYEKHYQMYANRLEKLNQEAQSTYQEYKECEANPSKCSPQKLQILEQDVQSAQEKIEKTNTLAKEDMANQESLLMKPLQEKVKKTIELVAKEKGYNMVIDNSAQIVVYSIEADNLNEAVKAKLGIKSTSGTKPATGGIQK